MKKILNDFLTEGQIYLVSAAFGFILGLLIFTFYTPNYYKGKAPRNFEIKEGSSLSMVIDDLYNSEIIPSKTNMHIAGFLYGAGRKIKSGRYKIPNGLSYLGLLELLVDGTGSPQTLVTIPEGIWQHKLAGILKAKLGLDSAKIMHLSSDKAFLHKLNIKAENLEGYLLPDSYYFYDNSSEEEVLRKLASEMDKLFDDAALERMRKLKMTKHQILTLASIIDGESNKESEFARIAGVYYNRLNRGMKLQADPTIQYLIRYRRKHNKLYYKYLEIDSPFNTYKYAGLPPAPINNPGRAAVSAALYPEKNDYLFFVADGRGGHAFAKTSRQHTRNVAKYREWRRKNR